MSVSGDFFDVIKLNDHCAGVLIADVMGHGTRSALVTAILRTLLQGLAKTGEDPGLFLSLLNSNFYDTMKRTDQLIFVSACFVVFDAREATAKCSSAGHPSPLIGNRRTGRVQPVYQGLKKNPALGLLPEASYQVLSHQLEENDIYLLFTDGVEEAMNPNDEYYGMERLGACDDWWHAPRYRRSHQGGRGRHFEVRRESTACRRPLPGGSGGRAERSTGITSARAA